MRTFVLKPYILFVLGLLRMLEVGAVISGKDSLPTPDENIPQRILMQHLGITETKDATPIIWKALQKVGFKHAVLVFPKGTYHFYTDNAIGKYHAVTNHDNTYKYFAFPLSGCEDIEIDGGGSDFIFHGVIVPFLIKNSSHIKLKNLTIDWEEPFYLQAEVVGRNATDKHIDLAVNPMTKTVYNGHRLGFLTNGVIMPDLGESMVFDPKTNAVAYNAKSHLMFNYASCTSPDDQLSENVFRVRSKFGKEPAPEGMVLVFKGPNRSNRLAPAIHALSSSNIALEHITIYHAGGMGVIAEKCGNIHLDHVNVTPRKGSGRMVSASADATHFCNCKGQLIIENCLFENMLDDGTNIHGTFVTMDEIVDAYTVRAKLGHGQQFGYNFAAAEDTIAFVNHETLFPIASAVVKSVLPINEQTFELSFKEKIPDGVEVSDGIDNISWYPSLTIFRNNIVRNNRARSVLVSVKNKVIIENNTFSSMMTGILLEGDLTHWYESGAVNDLTIRHNTFLDCVYGGGKGSAIWINPQMKKVVEGHPLEKNIVITGNEFRTFDNSILQANNVEGLIFSDNRIVETKTYPKLWPQNPVIDIKNCPRAVVQGNTYQGDEEAKVQIDESTASSLKLDYKQKGFNNEYSLKPPKTRH